jgi:hypothetical protein
VGFSETCRIGVTPIDIDRLLAGGRLAAYVVGGDFDAPRSSAYDTRPLRPRGSRY